MPNKIAIIGARGYPANFPGSSGIDSFIEQIIPYLKSEHTIYTRSWVKKNQKTKNIKPIFCIHNKYFDTGLYTLFSTVKAIFDKNNIFWFHAPGSALMIIFCKFLHKKTILTIHGIDWQRKKWNNPISKFILKKMEKYAVNCSDVCTGVSIDVCKYIKSTYNKKCILTSPYPIINSYVPPKHIKEKFSLSKNSYLLYMGRLVPEKRVDWLIQAYKKNNKIQKKYKLVIAGNIENNTYCNKIIKSASKNIIFTNYVSGIIKSELLSNCLVFIQASELEGNPISLQEAIGYNLKCLVSNIGVHQKVSKKYKNILTFNVNFDDFNKKIEIIINNQLFPQNKHNSWDKTANIYNKIFNS